MSEPRSATHGEGEQGESNDRHPKLHEVVTFTYVVPAWGLGTLRR